MSLDGKGKDGEKGSATADNFAASAPSISLPKGGGAIRGIGEKFAANPVTGTGSVSVPVFTTPGRSGLSPEFSLSYDSGSGNGPFGFGWSLSLPSVTRKTDKGLPKYRDADESDVFILSGAEDLVPLLFEDGGRWERHTQDSPPRAPGYKVERYRPRIEGLQRLRLRYDLGRHHHRQLHRAGRRRAVAQRSAGVGRRRAAAGPSTDVQRPA